MQRRLPVLCSILALALLTTLAGPRLAAQDNLPNEFKNLQILDPDISKVDLKATMKGFTEGLGVKCTFCHEIKAYDKDDSEHKVAARQMIRLVDHLRETKETYFPEDTEDDLLRCWTCHRGEAEIETSSDEDDDWVR